MESIGFMWCLKCMTVMQRLEWEVPMFPEELGFWISRKSWSGLKATLIWMLFHLDKASNALVLKLALCWKGTEMSVIS